MVAIPKFDYEELANIHDFSGMKNIILLLTSSQATTLKKVEKRASKYQLSSALEPNSIRTAVKGFLLFTPELWSSFKYPNLSQIRAMFIGGTVSSVSYDTNDDGSILVNINLKDGTC